MCGRVSKEGRDLQDLPRFDIELVFVKGEVYIILKDKLFKLVTLFIVSVGHLDLRCLLFINSNIFSSDLASLSLNRSS